MTYDIPTQVLFESSKRELRELVQKFQTEYRLPAYVIDGILTNELANIRNVKCDEVAQGYSTIIKQLSPDIETENTITTEETI